MFEARGNGARGNGADGSFDAVHRNPAGYLAAAERAFRGEIVELSFEGPRGGRWYELRLYPVDENQVAEIVVDITAHKLAERRQTELFDELNHRVKNNLALVSAILGMQARLTDDEVMAEHLRNAVARIQAIADVHGSLYRTGRKDDVDFASYLLHLCDRLSNSLVDRDHVRIELSADPATVPLDDAVALGLIVNELVTNAAKYAYPGTTGVVQVILRHTPEGLQLTVRDEGQGLSADPPRPGLGMRLVRSLVQQCGGALRIGAGPGASFTVDLRPRGSTAAAEAAQTPLL
jgi:two-component sensor histidine kinase